MRAVYGVTQGCRPLERSPAILMNETRSANLEVSRSVEIRQFEPGMYFNDRDHWPTTPDATLHRK